MAFNKIAAIITIETQYRKAKQTKQIEENTNKQTNKKRLKRVLYCPIYLLFVQNIYG